MKYLFFALITLHSSLFALTPEPLFPDVLSAKERIIIHTKVELQKADNTLQTPILNAEGTCFAKKKKLCQASGSVPESLEPFLFLSSNRAETLLLKRKRSFIEQHLPPITIAKEKLTLTFKAPKNSAGKHVQHIGTITDTGRKTTYVFHEGDYYIDALHITSEYGDRNDLLKIKTVGKVRLFLNEESYIIKRDDQYEDRAYIAINKDESSKKLFILSKAKLTIDASRRFKINAFIYGYDDVSIIGNKNATFKGAIHSDGVLTIGKEEPQHKKQKGGGTFVYAEKAVKKIDTAFETAEVINGHVLPPEPDPKINNSTLLGIDSNDNGVRDDVERWIYTRYNTYIPCIEKKIEVTIPDGRVITAYEDVCEDKAVPYHQIVREIAMQGARAAQIVIQEPERARETVKFIHAAIDCNAYFKNLAKYNNEPILVDKMIIDDDFNAIQFNTTQRARAYGKYNFALSGGVYSLPKEPRLSCDFDIDKLLGAK